jgi:serine/threonine-protein kinase
VPPDEPVRADVARILQAAGKTRSADPGQLEGEVLADRYRLEEVLGDGGMGCVYRAEHLTIGKRLAVKVLAPEFASNKEYRARFLREARAISQIDHENVVEVTDFGVAPNGAMFLVMELLRGEGISDLTLREGAIPWRRAKPMILQVCRAIEAAHAQGILHRDIKPDNCFRIERAGNPDFIKVLDFGLAKIVHGHQSLDASLTGVGRVMGTAEYMSPERVRDRPLDVRSDIYSLGILLYEMTTGSVPFSGDHYTEVFDQQLNASPVPPRRVAPRAGIPMALEAAILRAMQKEPSARFQTVREFADALSSIPEDEVGPPPPRSSLPKAAAIGSSRTKEHIYLAIIVVLTACLVGALALIVVLLTG